MTSIVETAQKLLDDLEEPAPTPWRLNEVTVPTDKVVIGTLRNNTGWPVIKVHPESETMLVGDRRVLNFILNAPQVIKELIELIELNNRPNSKKAPEEVKIA